MTFNGFLIVLLAAILGAALGKFAAMRQIMQNTFPAFTPDTPLFMRIESMPLYGISIMTFMNRTSTACVRCPRCDDRPVLRSFCPRCGRKGYLVIPDSQIVEYDLPSRRGFLREARSERFKGVLTDHQLNMLKTNSFGEEEDEQGEDNEQE